MPNSLKLYNRGINKNKTKQKKWSWDLKTLFLSLNCSKRVLHFFILFFIFHYMYMQHLKNEQVNKSPIEQQSKVSFIALVGLHSWELQRHCSDCSAGQKRAFIVKLSESPVLDPLFPGNQYLGIRHTTRSLTGYLWHLAIFSSYWSLAFTNSRFLWVFVCTNHFVFVFFF